MEGSGDAAGRESWEVREKERKGREMKCGPHM